MSKSRIVPVLMVAGAFATAGVVSGCGSSSSTSSTTSSAADAENMTSVAKDVAKGNTVVATLTEMKVVPVPKTAKAGNVTFDTLNKGQLPHEMVVIKTDKPANSLGTGSEVPATGAVGETGDIAAGQSKKLTLKLAAGHYALICNLPGHYVAGMYADFNVS